MSAVASPSTPLTDNCFISINDSGATDYSSADGSAVQIAIDTADAGNLLKIAGTCSGVTHTEGISQTAYISKSLTLQGGYTTTNWLADSDPSSYPAVLDAQGNGRVIYITSNPHVTLDGLTLQNGFTDNDGGGIYSAGTLTLTNSLVTHNYADDSGGGLNAASSISGTTTISNSDIISNTGWTEFGGGLYSRQPITITNSRINQNRTSEYGGGAAFGSAHVLIENSDIISNVNTQYEGGGLYFDAPDSQVTIRASRVLSNVAPGSIGGGLYDESKSNLFIIDSEFGYNQGTAGAGIHLYDESRLTLVNSTVHHNIATEDEGGGIFVESGSIADIRNSTISHNSATEGGGIFVTATNSGSSPASASITLTHVTVVSNTAVISGGGLHLDDRTDGNSHIAQASIQNSLIAHNSGGDCGLTNGWEELDVTAGYNLDSDGRCVTDGVDNNLTRANAGIDTLTDHDEGAPTHALLSDSPALDAIPLEQCSILTDQRGVARPQDTGCDIGAYELIKIWRLYIPFISVSDGSLSQAEISLRD